MRRMVPAFVCLCIVLAVSCAKPASVSTIASGGVVRVEARDFAFEPNTIKAAAGRSLDLDVVNTSGSAHNITVESPSGEKIVSRDIPAGQTARVSITPSEPGRYKFYCNKPFHPSMGMTGRIEVE